METMDTIRAIHGNTVTQSTHTSASTNNRGNESNKHGNSSNVNEPTNDSEERNRTLHVETNVPRAHTLHLYNGQVALWKSIDFQANGRQIPDNADISQFKPFHFCMA